MTAILEALNLMEGAGHDVSIYTDSAGSVSAIQKLHKAKANLDLVEAVWYQQERIAVHGHKVYYIWIQGHANNPQNAVADSLARAEAKRWKEYARA